MSPDRVYVGKVSRVGIVQHCKKTRYASAMLSHGEQLSNVTRQVKRQHCFQDWELFSNVIRQYMPQQCYKVANSSAMK